MKILYKYQYFSIFSCLLLIRLFLIYLDPIPSLDSTYSCTPALSLINKSFPLNHFTYNSPANLFGYLSFPFFIIYSGGYSIFVLFEIFKIFLCYQIFQFSRERDSLQFGLFFLVLVFMDRTVNYYGEEIFLSALILYSIRKLNVLSFGISYLLVSSTLFILHPVSAAVMIITSFLLGTKKHNFISNFKKRLIVNNLLLLIFILTYIKFTTFGENILLYSQSKYGLSDFGSFFHYIIISAPIIVFSLLSVASLDKKSKRVVAIISFVFFIFFTFLQGYYYFHYWVIGMFVIICESKLIDWNFRLNFKKKIEYVILIMSFFVFAIYPLSSLALSENYINSIRAIHRK